MDRVMRRLALLVPRRLRYWCLIAAGVEHIRGNEVVPDVPFTEVLSREGKMLRG
jgi:hypothetical protein